jgi:hypothetical protein
LSMRKMQLENHHRKYLIILPLFAFHSSMIKLDITIIALKAHRPIAKYEYQ